MRIALRFATASLGALTLTACADHSVPATAPGELPLSAMAAASPNAASPNAAVDVIVTFDDSEANPSGRARALLSQFGGTQKHVYQHALKGFAARMSPRALEQLERLHGIRRVELDGLASADATTITSRSWGQDRIDQRALPLNQSYTFPNSGSGVRVYILDTGILPTHQEFAGRLLPGFSAFGDNSTVDCHGHGTHVAGTAAGATVGVAPGAQVVPVRVLDCTSWGSWSGIIAGIDWVTAQKNNNKSIPMIANMSIGGSFSSSVNSAVARSIQAGVVYTISAGNSNIDACTQTPASTPDALTIGATDAWDSRASWSNWGTCLDLFAPGANIYSAYHTGSAAYAAMNGTSMAAPHVAGVAALVLSSYAAYTPAQVRNVLVSGATAEIVKSQGTGSPNLLLTNLFSADTTTPQADTTPPQDTVTTPTVSTPVLAVTRQVQRNSNNALLAWSAVSGSSAEVWRNGVRLLTTANDGSHDDRKLARGTYSYRVCNVGATACSPTVSVTF